MRTTTIREKAVKVLAMLGAATLFAQGAYAQSAGTVIAGPYTVPIVTSKTISFATNFNVPPPIQGSYILRVQLSAPNSFTTLSVKLNGAQLYSLSDFAGGVTSVDKLVTLAASDSIAVSVAGVVGNKVTVTVFTVAMPQPTAIAPSPLALNAGANGTLTATLSPAPTASGTLTVSSSNTGIATVPSSVSFASGQTSVSIPVTAVAGGSASITASANGGQATSTVNVNALPTVSLTAPANGTLYSAPASITLSANAADSDGTVAKVDFFDGGTLVGTATAAPYSATLSNAAAGVHSLTARATDNLGAISTSAAVTVTVDAPPTVSLSAPANNAVYPEPATVTLTASATDAVGNVSKVDFYQGTTFIGSATAAPYSFAWTGVQAGNYSLTAIATNDGGGTTTSAPIAIKVDSAPTVTLDSPANNAVFAQGVAVSLSGTPADTVGAIAKVDFYEGANLIGTANASPYTVSWTPSAPGVYSLTAVVTNDANMTATSTAVAVTVDAAPSVSISSPADGSSFTAPATINLAVTSGDTTGTVTQVDYYQNGTPIGSSMTAPFGFAWTNVAVGSYSITAVATNDAGETTTSAAINIMVKSGIAQVYYIETDHLNTPRLIQDQNGNAVWRNDNAEPFGDSVPNADPNNTGTSFEFNLRFLGQYADKETGLSYNASRDFEPSIGRYVQSDPIGLLGGNNTYAYVDSNPLVSVDPEGLIGQLRKRGKWAQCSREDWKFCEQFCGDRGVESCRRWWSIRTELIGGKIVEGWKPAPEPSCNCKECPPAPSPGPRGKDDDLLNNLLGGGDSPKPNGSPFGPFPSPQWLPAP